MWRPDGWGWRARIGLLVPHADMCEEAEFMAMAPPGVSIHTTRVPFRGMGKGGTMAPSIGSAERVPRASQCDPGKETPAPSVGRPPNSLTRA
jgi:hypothetical protein